MLGLIGRILGSEAVVSKGMELIDDAWTTEEESRESRTKAKTELLKAYAPFKLTQRVLAFAFSGVFLFIMLNGVIGALYGVIDMERVDHAIAFANKMWLGEIMLAIVSFYFGGGFFESLGRKDNGKQ